MKTAEKVFAHDRHWREAKPDERRLIFDECVTDLRKREEVSLAFRVLLMTDRRSRVAGKKHHDSSNPPAAAGHFSLDSMESST